MTRFLLGVFHTHPSLPRDQEILHISIVFTYFKSLHPPEKLTLKDLTMKNTMLVASLSGQRCQTIHTLDVNNRKFYEKPMDTEAASFGTELLHAISA